MAEYIHKSNLDDYLQQGITFNDWGTKNNVVLSDIMDKALNKEEAQTVAGALTLDGALTLNGTISGTSVSTTGGNSKLLQSDGSGNLILTGTIKPTGGDSTSALEFISTNSHAFSTLETSEESRFAALRLLSSNNTTPGRVEIRLKNGLDSKFWNLGVDGDADFKLSHNIDGNMSSSVILRIDKDTDILYFKNSIIAENSIFVKEKTSAETSTAGFGQLWIKNDSPNTLMFTDDAGNDYTVDLTAVTP